MRRRLLLLAALMVVPLTLIAGIWAGAHPEVLPGAVRDALVDDPEAQAFDEALDSIASDYFRRVDRGDLLDAALAGAVDSLEDEFSKYFDPRTFAHFQDATEGEFEGVGIGVQPDPRGLRVAQVFKGGPALAAGIERGDLIVAVDGRSLAGLSSQRAAELVKGPTGTTVRLTILTDGKRRVEVVKRAAVEIPVVRSRSERRGGGRFAHLTLAQFSNGAHGELGRALRAQLREGADGVVLDLRGNPGGLLEEAVLVSSLFIADGEIVSTNGRSRERRSYTASGDAIDGDVPVVVLVDGGSASAAEIVAGALQDRERATVVGARTFGKGVFQEVEPLANGGALDLTVGEYFTPDGRNLAPRDGEPGGIAPDVRAADDPKTRRDEALERALEVLAERS